MQGLDDHSRLCLAVISLNSFATTTVACWCIHECFFKGLNSHLSDESTLVEACHA